MKKYGSVSYSDLEAERLGLLTKEDPLDQEYNEGGRSWRFSHSLFFFFGGGIGAILFLVVAFWDVEVSSESSSQYNNLSHEVFELEISNGYPQLESLHLYNFPFVVEPYRTTSLKIPEIFMSASSTPFSWEILDENNNPLEVTSLDATLSSEVSAVFTSAGSFYTIQVEGNGLSVQTKVICKYVRREIRSLNDDDKSNFLNALKIFHTIDSEEGKRLYGEDFFNYQDLTNMHLATVPSGTGGGAACSPWHSGPGFLTSHLALARLVERALQLVEPSVAAPYWDYVADGASFGAAWAEGSPVLGAGWLGGAAPLGGGLPLARAALPGDEASTWGWVPELASGWGARRNPAGLATDPYNADAGGEGVWRAPGGAVCGRRVAEVGLPGCAAERAALGAAGLAAARAVLELDLHSNLHTLVGGARGCGVDAAAALAPGGALASASTGTGAGAASAAVRLAADAALVAAPQLWAAAHAAGAYGDGPELVCQEVADVAALSDEEVDALNEAYGFYDVLAFLATYTPEADRLLRQAPATGATIFDGADEAENAALKRFLLALGCTAGQISAFATPLAATNDPLFLPVHTLHQKHWAALQLAAREGFDYAWPEGGCWGHGEEDRLPWARADLLLLGGAEGEGKGEGGGRLTNRQLLELFDPRNARLPYIHDNLEFKACGSSSAT